MMLLVTLIFTGSSLYSTIFISQRGSIHAIESIFPTLQSTSLEKDKSYNDELIKSKESKKNMETQMIKIEAKTAQNETKIKFQRLKN